MVDSVSNSLDSVRILERRIMLSGFDAAEANFLTAIVRKLRGVVSSDPSNPQAFVPDCTHVISKRPNRNEKYLAGCASGKWILTQHYLHDSDRERRWLHEKDYEWGVDVSSDYPLSLQLAPKRWREMMNINNMPPPFLGWSVGLVMKKSLAHAYTRIVRAGGGDATNITSWYSPEAIGSSNASRALEQGLLTHVLVTNNMTERVVRKRRNNIPCLKAEYLALYLLNHPPPNPDEYSVFRRNTARPVSTNYGPRKLHGQEDDSDADGLDYSSTGNSPVKRQRDGLSTSVKIGTPVSKASEVPNVQQANIRSMISPNPSPKRSVVANLSVLKVRSIGKVGQFSSSSPESSSSNPNDRSVFKYLETTGMQFNLIPGRNQKQPIVQLHDVRHRMAQGQQQQRQQQRQKSTGARDHVPSIMLSRNRAQRIQPPSGRGTFKPLFPENFVVDHYDILQEFASRKMRLETPFGIVNELFATETSRVSASIYNRDRRAKPFSKDVIASLEASLEVSYSERYSNFLKEVLGRTDETAYPPSDVVYVIMKVILLDAEDAMLAEYAFQVLNKIVLLHPPQSPAIHEVKLYHKALTLMTVLDEADASPIMVAIGNMLSMSDKDNWSLWCTRDPTLSVHWTFYSRVLNLAIRPTTAKTHKGEETNGVSTRKMHNAVLLNKFLTTLVEMDYKEVISRKDFPSNIPMIKCLIADMLWPSLTGLEPWFRRSSPNLTDLVSLFVKAAAAYASYVDEDASSGRSSTSDGSEDETYSAEYSSWTVLEQISRLIVVTASWCVFCDIRYKERVKRAATRPLEQELVKSLRFELEDCHMDVMKLALENLPLRLRLKVIADLLHDTCADDLVTDSAKASEEISLEVITARYMQLLPVLTMEGEELIPAKEDDSSMKTIDENKVTEKPDPASFKINKRNEKGETALHRACMSNRPDTVRELLAQPGIDPNMTDYAGWTPLGEACNHGHLACVEALLELPVADKTSFVTPGALPQLRIDLTLCPKEEGATPLHEALGNGHLDIACLLLKKGGVALLNKAASDHKTPLDYCCSEAARAYIIEFTCQLATDVEDKAHVKNPLMTLANVNRYNEILPNQSIIRSGEWRERVRWYVTMTNLLLSHYVISGYLQRAVLLISPEDNKTTGKDFHVTDDVVVIDDSDDDAMENVPKKAKTRNSFNDVTKLDIQRFANEVTFCLRWKQCWDCFRDHVLKILGGDEGALGAIMVNFESPIPLDSGFSS